MEPVDNVPVPMPNGSAVNVAVYAANWSAWAGNATVVVYGYVSRIGVDLTVIVFGVPPAGYNASVAGLDAGPETSYKHALLIHIHYQPPQDTNSPPQLIPKGTLVKIEIQPLNLTVLIPVEG